MNHAMPAIAVPGGAPRRGRSFARRGLAATLLLTVLVAGCNRAPAPPQGPKAVKVVVTTPITDPVIDYQDFTGRLEAVKSIEIRSRVTGHVNEVPFKEGAVVKQGDL